MSSKFNTSKIRNGIWLNEKGDLIVLNKKFPNKWLKKIKLYNRRKRIKLNELYWLA